MHTRCVRVFKRYVLCSKRTIQHLQTRCDDKGKLSLNIAQTLNEHEINNKKKLKLNNNNNKINTRIQIYSQ